MSIIFAIAAFFAGLVGMAPGAEHSCPIIEGLAGVPGLPQESVVIDGLPGTDGALGADSLTLCR